jgi:hypothetical protein
MADDELFNNGYPFEITPATPDQMALTDSFTNMSDPATFGGSGGGWFDNWNWNKIGKAAEAIKGGLGDVKKLTDPNAPAQGQQRTAGSAPVVGQTRAPATLAEVLQQLLQRRQQLATLGLSGQPYAPRGPGGGLLRT